MPTGRRGMRTEVRRKERSDWRWDSCKLVAKRCARAHQSPTGCQFKTFGNIRSGGFFMPTGRSGMGNPFRAHHLGQRNACTAHRNGPVIPKKTNTLQSGPRRAPKAHRWRQTTNLAHLTSDEVICAMWPPRAERLDSLS